MDGGNRVRPCRDPLHTPLTAPLTPVPAHTLTAKAHGGGWSFCPELTVEVVMPYPGATDAGSLLHVIRQNISALQMDVGSLSVKQG